jgi:hypothetical protein
MYRNYLRYICHYFTTIASYLRLSYEYYCDKCECFAKTLQMHTTFLRCFYNYCDCLRIFAIILQLLHHCFTITSQRFYNFFGLSVTLYKGNPWGVQHIFPRCHLIRSGTPYSWRNSYYFWQLLGCFSRP